MTGSRTCVETAGTVTGAQAMTAMTCAETPSVTTRITGRTAPSRVTATAETAPLADTALAGTVTVATAEPSDAPVPHRPGRHRQLAARAAVPGVRHHWIEMMRAHLRDESGMSTIEYALGCVAAAALGALLYTVVTSDAVESALTAIFERALSQK